MPDMTGDEREPGIRLAELVAALSLATDLPGAERVHHRLAEATLSCRYEEHAADVPSERDNAPVQGCQPRPLLPGESQEMGVSDLAVGHNPT